MIQDPLTKVWLYSAPAIVGVLAGLWRYSLVEMDQFHILAATVFLGLLAYGYLLPVQMLKRRALLEHVTTESSLVRRLLWSSSLVKLALAASSVITAVFVLVMVTGLQLLEWYVLFASVISFLALYGASAKFLGAQLNDKYRFHVILRIANRSNLVVMTVVLVVVQILWFEMDDTRYLSILEVFQDTFTQQAASVAVSEVGWLIGLNSAITDSLWHLMQLASQTDSAMLTKLLAWLAFLIFNAVKLGAVWTILLGIPSFVYALLRQEKSPNNQGRRCSAPGTIIASCLILGFGVYLMGAKIKVAPFVNSISARVHEALGFDPCRRQAPLEQKELAQQANHALTQEHQQLMAQISRDIDQYLDQVFEMAESGVDSFLDWNFSLKGQYTQLLFLSKSMVGESSFAEHIGARMESHIDDAISPGLEGLHDRLNLTFANGMQKVLAKQEAYLDLLVRQADCVTPTTPDLPLTDFVNKSLVGTGLVVGPAVGMMAVGAGARAVRPAARVTAGTGSRVAAKPTSRRIISGMFGRLSARAAASTASGTAGTVCGPFVLACGSAFTVATWIGMDLAINELDEAFNRRQMRKDMIEVLNGQKISFKAQLESQYGHAAALAFGAIEDYQHQTFNIRRDALGENFYFPSRVGEAID